MAEFLEAYGGPIMLGFGLTTMFGVNTITGGVAQQQKCEDAKKNLDELNGYYKSFIESLKKNQAPQSSELIQYSTDLINKTNNTMNAFNNINNNKSKTNQTIQIIALSIIATFIVLLFLKYYIFSIIVKN